MSADWPRCRTVLAALLATVVVMVGAAGRAEIIGPGDDVVTIGDTPVMDRSEVLAVVKKGRSFTVERVNGEWVLVSAIQDGRTVNGWMQTKFVAKREPGLRLAQVETRDLASQQCTIWTMEPGLAQTIQVRSTTPVDCFLLSQEGKASYDWILKNGSGQATVFNHHYNTRDVKFRWVPPDDGQYYFIVDNTSFPDEGASGSYGAQYTVMFWFDDP